MTEIRTKPLTREAFALFGQVVDRDAAAQTFSMNAGRAQRFYDLARVELAGVHPRPVVSLARSDGKALPYTLEMVERHPLGSQMFFPLSERPFLVIVAPDDGGAPGTPIAFVTAPGQGINYAINTWHGVLTPLGEPAEFLILDRGGEGDNLVEHRFTTPYTVIPG